VELIPKKQVEAVSLFVAAWLRIAFAQFLSSESGSLMGIKDLAYRISGDQDRQIYKHDLAMGESGVRSFSPALINEYLQGNKLLAIAFKLRQPRNFT
jgi:hypothetical protein